MNVRFLLLVRNNSAASYVDRRGRVVPADGPEWYGQAKTWATLAGVEKWMATQNRRGRRESFIILPAPPSAASALGARGAGIPRRISPEESAARAERLALARRWRWAPPAAQ